jgi:hypothetical protein
LLVDLHSNIHPAKSKVIVKTDKITIKLKKMDAGVTWPNLQAQKIRQHRKFVPPASSANLEQVGDVRESKKGHTKFCVCSEKMG